MAQEKINEVVGNSFEDLKIDEMTEIQGAGDVDAETTPVVVTVSAATIAATGGYCASKEIYKSAKNSSC
ncbi:MAG: lichenicidin A2 family type 2 lantibiotic [Butyrivibrio sp.]|nr:lichenicidin A2 family type 2 lantibiotic [Butyrivibrio sp.]